MKSISSFNDNNPDHINGQIGSDSANKGNYTPSYLANANSKNDEVTFTGDRKNKKVNPFKMLVLTLATALGLSGCTPATPVQQNSGSQAPESAVTETMNGAQESNDAAAGSGDVQLLDMEEGSIPVVSVMSTTTEGTDRVFPNIHFEKTSVEVVHNSSNEVDQCETLLELINKQYVEPFLNSGETPEALGEDEIDHIAREIIESNPELQEAIKDKYNLGDEDDAWMNIDNFDELLNTKLYDEFGITSLIAPDQVEIHGISSESPLYNKTESATTIYSTKNDTITLDNSVETLDELYAAFAGQYKDIHGNNADTTAASIATWLAIKDNQYNEDIFGDRLNDDGDRVDTVLLDILKGLDDGETIELKLPDAFGVNLTASGKPLESVSPEDAYHIVHEMSPTELSFTLDADKKVTDETQTQGVYDFIDILTYYQDPDTGELYAQKTEKEDADGNKYYEFTYNQNVPDLNAKAY